MIFAEAVIVFVGVAGNHHEVVERQLGPVLDHAGVNEIVVPASDLAAIVRHSDASRDAVQRLHVDGVIGGALITSNGQQTFRLVIYDGKGNMRSLGETPLTGAKLGADDLEVLGLNLAEEVGSLQVQHPTSSPRIAVAPRAEPAPESSVAPHPAEPAPGEAPAPTQVANADAVSLDEIEAMTGGGASEPSVTNGTAPTASDDTLRLHIDAGLGMTGRVFSAPAGVTGYTSTPVSTVQFAAGVSPTARTSLGVAAERTISMSTTLGSGAASTQISRWQIDGSYIVIDGGVQVAANLGVGHRAFMIDAAEAAGRTPDSEYSYVTLGVRLAKPIGERFVLRGNLDFQPVFGGADAMQMALGTSSRWGLDVGAAGELALVHHFVARASFDYQQFSWSWATTNTSASDSYPTATLALRSEF